MNNINKINKKIIVPIFLFVFLASVIIIKISLPSYALEEINNACNHNNTSIEEAYITDDNGKVEFENAANISVETTGAKQYSVKVLLSFDSNKKEVDITLKDGIKWISWDNETTASGIVKSVTSEEYKKYETKTGSYTIQSGKKTFVIKDEIVCANLNFVIAADIPLRVKEIKDAITIEQKYIENNEEKTNIKTLDIEIDYDKIPIIVNGSKNGEELVGSIKEQDKNYYNKARLSGVYIAYQGINALYKNVEIEIETPKDVIFTDYTVAGSGNYLFTQTEGWEPYERTSTDTSEIYIFKYKDINSSWVGINPIWNFSKTGAQDGDNISIKVKSLKYQLYDNKEIIHKFNDSSCVAENNDTKQVICRSEQYENNYTIRSQEKLILDIGMTINTFNPKHPEDIIYLGHLNFENKGTTSEERVVNIKYDSTKIGVTHISLPAIMGVRIKNFKYKLEGSDDWITNFDEKKFTDPLIMSTTYSTNLGYVNFTNDIIETNKYITEVEYEIGDIPMNAHTSFIPGVFSYSGIIKKQDNDEYAKNFVTNITVKNQDGSKIIKSGKSTTTVSDVNLLTTCPHNKLTSSAYIPGETISFNYSLAHCTHLYQTQTTPTREPIIYIRLPKGLILEKESVYILPKQINKNLQIIKERTKNYTITERNDKNHNIYKIEFNNNEEVNLGYPKYSNYLKESSGMAIVFNAIIPEYYSDNGIKHLYNEVMFLTDASMDENTSSYGMNPEYLGSTGDKYDVDGDGKTTDLMTYGPVKDDYFQIKTNPDINTYLSIKTNEEETNEIVIIKNSANVNIKAVNNSGVDNQKGEIYIPIPRIGEYWKGLMYCDENNDCSEYSYNLYLEELLKENDKYKIYYGKNIKPITKYNDLKNIEKWYNNTELKTLTKEELKEINLIKIEVLDIDNNEEINIELKLYSDEKNTKGIKYNDLSAAYYRDLKNTEGDVLTGWKKTNYVNIGLGLSEEIIETPITSSEISVIIMIFAIPMMIYGMYLIWQSVKEHKDKMDK